jgi:hypothetical protein
MSIGEKGMAAADNHPFESIVRRVKFVILHPNEWLKIAVCVDLLPISLREPST